MEGIFCYIELFAGLYAPRHTAFKIRDMAVFSGIDIGREIVCQKEKTAAVEQHPVKQLNRIIGEAADFVVPYKISSFFAFYCSVFWCRAPPDSRNSFEILEFGGDKP